MPTLGWQHEQYNEHSLYSSICISCKSGGGRLSKGCRFEHFSELTGAGEESSRS